LPIADTLMAMIRRAVRHRPLFSADRAHIHHKLIDLGLTQKQAVLILYGASILLGGTALLLTIASSVQSAAILATMAMLGFVAIRKLGYGRLRHASSSQADIDAHRQFDRLAGATSEERMWFELRSTAKALGMAAIRLSLVYRSESDSVAIQREHGNWDEPTSHPGAFDFLADATSVKVEFLCTREPSQASVESMRQATQSACTRIFGKEPETRVARTEEPAAAR
jgi:hypothetical protein